MGSLARREDEEGRIPEACSPKAARRATGNGRAPGAGEEGLLGMCGVVEELVVVVVGDCGGG